MKSLRRFSIAVLFLQVVFGPWLSGQSVTASEKVSEWNAGVASVVITPEDSMWMAGYAARNKPSEGLVHDLFAKALVLEDAAGTRLVIITTDLIGIPRALREGVETAARQKYNLPEASLLMNASHTHSGPELRATKASIYGLGADRVAQAHDYLKRLEAKLVMLIGQAISNLQPSNIHYSHARAGFAMNRRLPTERGFLNRPNPDGPVDQSVPVLRVTDTNGKLQAVLFGYACHNTTLGFYKFCGDYAGFAQEYLEAAHPGTVAMFLMGCGGDQNPYPRRTLELAQQHGRSLANAVETTLQALKDKPNPISGPLRVALEHVTLEFATPPSKEELLKLKESGNKYDRRHAELLLDNLATNGKINTEYPFPVQVVQFGNDLTLVALAGETVIDYSLRLKKELRTPGKANSPVIWVAGYSNDVFAYIPSLRVLKEGGYEGGGAMRYGQFPGPWKPSVEDRIIRKVHQLVKQVRSAGKSSQTESRSP
jgi:neutral ceramidase